MPNTTDQNEPPGPGPTREAIAHRAYELFLQRGSAPGYELDDWLQAEAELAAEAAKLAEEDAGEPPTDAVSSPGRTRRPGTRERASGRRTIRP